jgi:hypothetical protein
MIEAILQRELGIQKFSRRWVLHFRSVLSVLKNVCTIANKCGSERAAGNRRKENSDHVIFSLQGN